MFNYEKVREMENRTSELEHQVRHEASWRKKADEDARANRAEAERLRGFISVVADKLVPKKYYATAGIPDWSKDVVVTAESPKQSSSTPESVIRNHIRQLELDAKARIEREKIEKIVLDLRDRKWEPAE